MANIGVARCQLSLIFENLALVGQHQANTQLTEVSSTKSTVCGGKGRTIGKSHGMSTSSLKDILNLDKVMYTAFAPLNCKAGILKTVCEQADGIWCFYSTICSTGQTLPQESDAV